MARKNNWQYSSFDSWIYKNAQIDFNEIDKLKNNPNKAREEIRQAVMDLFSREQDRLENEAKSIKSANSIDGYADYLFKRHDKPGELSSKIGEIEEWEDKIKVGDFFIPKRKEWLVSKDIQQRYQEGLASLRERIPGKIPKYAQVAALSVRLNITKKEATEIINNRL